MNYIGVLQSPSFAGLKSTLALNPLLTYQKCMSIHFIPQAERHVFYQDTGNTEQCAIHTSLHGDLVLFATEILNILH